MRDVGKYETNFEIISENELEELEKFESINYPWKMFHEEDIKSKFWAYLAYFCAYWSFKKFAPYL